MPSGKDKFPPARIHRILNGLEKTAAEVEGGTPEERTLAAAKVEGLLEAISGSVDQDTDGPIAARIEKLNEFVRKHSDAMFERLPPQKPLKMDPIDPRFLGLKAPWVRFREPQTSATEVAKPVEAASSSAKEARAELLRRRNVPAHEDIQADDPEDARLLKEQQRMQETFSEEMVKMAEQLKANSLMFGESLSKDKAIMDDAQDQLHKNVTSITAQNTKLSKVLAATRGNCFMITAAMLLVCFLFVFAFVFMKLFRPVKY